VWFFRRILRILWTAKQTNEEVLKRANNRRKLIAKYKLTDADLMDM